MKVEIVETFSFPPERIFATITDIPHHVDWMEYPIELASLNNGPARLGTTWEQNADRLGKKLVLMNTCNIYEKNRKFGWRTEKPFLAQASFLLEPERDGTKLTWAFESEESAIVQLAEPLLNRQTNEMIQKSLARLRAYLRIAM
jgi:hypothetical protein